MAVCVIGAGGHAKVVIATLRAAGYAVRGAFDDDPALEATRVLGVPVLGRVAAARAHHGPVVLAVGGNAARRRLARALGDSADWLTVVHPKADVHETVRLGRGTVVFSGAVLQPGATAGQHAIVNTGATVDHDCTLAGFVHVAPGAHLAGAVRLEEGVLLGVGASVIPDVTVGAWSVVGAGAAVVRDLPPGVVAAGVPARIIRRRAG